MLLAKIGIISGFSSVIYDEFNLSSPKIPYLVRGIPNLNAFRNQRKHFLKCQELKFLAFMQSKRR